MTTTVHSVKPETAQRLAATATEGLTTAQARAVILEYLAQLARCPVCDNTGRFTYDREVPVNLSDRPHGMPESSYITPGATSPCPRCLDGHGDPEFVAWHCWHDRMERDCRHAQQGGSGVDGDHERCGYRIVLAIPGQSTD